MSDIAQFATQIQDRLQPFVRLAEAIEQGQIAQDDARSVMISSLNQSISVMEDVVRYLRAGSTHKPYTTQSYERGRTYARIRLITRQHSTKGRLFLNAYRLVKPISYSLKGVFLWTALPLRTPESFL